MNTTVLVPKPSKRRSVLFPQAVATTDPTGHRATSPTGDRCPDPCRGILLSVVGTNLLVCYSCGQDFYRVTVA